MSETEQKAKISIIEVIKEAAFLYKDNAWLFLKISFLGFIVNITNNILNHYMLLHSDFHLFNLLRMILLSLLGVYIMLAAYICIFKRFNNKEITIKEAFQATKERFWEYMLISFLLFLILYIPSALIYPSYNAIEYSIVKWFLIAISSIPFIYLNTIFIFAPLLAILVKGGVKYFRISKKLVEGYFWPVFILTMLLSFVLAIPYKLYSQSFFGFGIIIPVSPYIASLLDDLIILFANPLLYSISVILLYKLITIKKIYLPLNNPKNYKIKKTKVHP